jgi:error-prone DNA polymerase
MPITVGGLIVCRQRPGTAKGITFLLLEDEHGLINVVVSRQIYEDQRLLVRGEPFLLIEGELQRRHNAINLRATRIHPLAEARIHISRELAEREDPEIVVEPVYGQELEALAPRSHNYR